MQREKCFYISGLPDPTKNLVAYCRKQKKHFGYTSDEVKNFTLQARTYFSFRISQRDSDVGFIVLESLEKEFKDEEFFKKEFLQHNDFLYYVISVFRHWIPTYEQAMKESF